MVLCSNPLLVLTCCCVDLFGDAAAADVAFPMRLVFVRGRLVGETSTASKARFLSSFEALRNEAGVMLGDTLWSEIYSEPSVSELELGVLGRLGGGKPFLLFMDTSVRRNTLCMREDMLTGFNAPGLAVLRCILTVVCLVDVKELLAVCRTAVGRNRFDLVMVADRFIARFSRDAICLECSAALTSARS